ncbi:peroxiredoxin [Thiobacillus sedimenti]|uniref:thioredoxin-dependent peroxiredoxin n=1 Tax=Thiobacillus sedimenti TaxID=3110231 RepID=A0ABZ1CKI7_9PROT|nr:peroxiredoxin [Thiobacillus sp. SCUT-2]WRS39900.1 peroxiredoxin [Thiobacillus sp. SCUT-2]
MLKAGDRAPDFSNPDADMNIAELSQFRGRTLVLYFYVRDDTPGCTTEALEFSELEGEFAKLGATVLGVSRDDCIRHGEFRDKHGIGVRLLADKDQTTSEAYGVLQDKEVDGAMRKSMVRSTFVIDKQGIIRHALYGVSSRGHAAEVLQLVKELK